MNGRRVFKRRNRQTAVILTLLESNLQITYGLKHYILHTHIPFWDQEGIVWWVVEISLANSRSLGLSDAPQITIYAQRHNEQ